MALSGKSLSSYMLDRFDSENVPFSRIEEQLRENGCNSPTFERIWEVFRKIQQLIVINKLNSGEPSSWGHIRMLDLRKMLNGPDDRLDFGGNGIEFSKWYIELLTLQAAGLISMGSLHHRISCSTLVIGNFGLKNPTEDEIQAILHRMVTDDKVLRTIKQHIITRAKAFDIVHLLVDAMYAERSNGHQS